MSLTLYYHPLSSFCWKALIALYENDTPFAPQLVDLSKEDERAALSKIWPIGKFPVLRDSTKDRIVPESSIIIEYLDRHYPGATRFLPEDADAARQVRLRDRFYDLYVHLPENHSRAHLSFGTMSKYGSASVSTRANDGRCFSRSKYAATFLCSSSNGTTMLP